MSGIVSFQSHRDINQLCCSSGDRVVAKRRSKEPIRLFGAQTNRIILAGNLVSYARKGLNIGPFLQKYGNMFTEGELEEAAFVAAEKCHWHVVAQLALSNHMTTRSMVRMVNYTQKTGASEMQKVLWDCLMNTGTTDERRADLLMEAVDIGSKALVGAVLRGGNVPPDYLGQALIACCQKETMEEIDQEEMLEQILRASGDKIDSTSYSTALIYSLERGLTGLIRLLLGAGETVQKRAEAASVEASDQGESLISFFLDFDTNQGKALKELIRWCYEKRGTEEYPRRLFAAGQIVQAELTGEGVVAISGLGLTTLPDCFHLFESLRRLELDANELTDLPPNFDKCKTLETLSLLDNQFPAMPEPLRFLQSADCKAFVPAHFQRAKQETEVEFVYVGEEVQMEYE